MVKILISPAKYIQGPFVLRDIGKYLSPLGSRIFFIGGQTALSILRDIAEESLKGSPLEYTFEEFKGECTRENAEGFVLKAREFKAEVICGIGGGKALDTAKAVAYELDLRIVTIPTVASSDAPCSSLIVQFKENHTIDRFLMLRRNPDLVLVDSKVIAEAPVRFLVAGMGDALSTYFEAMTCTKSNAKNVPGGHATALALKAARLCYETLLSYGYEATLAVKKKVVTEALERVIEANILLSGLGFESGGLALAHGIQDGLHTLEGTEACLHGELVGFSTLVHLVLENYPRKTIEKVIGFMKKVGLPLTLEDLGVRDKSKDNLMKAATFACKEGLPTHNAYFEINPEMIFWGILAADALGEEAKKGFF